MRLVVASVVECLLSVVTTTAFCVCTVTLALGLPEVPPETATASRGALGETPVKEEAANLIASVLPVMVTDIVFEPVVVAMRYHSSVALVPVRVVLARVKEPPFHEARVMAPVPPMSWKISAERMMIGLVPVTVWVHVLVIVPVNPVVMLVEVASKAMVEVEILDPLEVALPLPVIVERSTLLAKRCFVVVVAEPAVAL